MIIQAEQIGSSAQKMELLIYWQTLGMFAMH
jgi:hypothetical protein